MTYRENGICFSLYTNNDFMRAALVASDYDIYCILAIHSFSSGVSRKTIYLYIYIYTRENASIFEGLVNWWCQMYGSSLEDWMMVLDVIIVTWRSTWPGGKSWPLSSESRSCLTYSSRAAGDQVVFVRWGNIRPPTWHLVVNRVNGLMNRQGYGGLMFCHKVVCYKFCCTSY